MKNSKIGAIKGAIRNDMVSFTSCKIPEVFRNNSKANVFSEYFEIVFRLM